MYHGKVVNISSVEFSYRLSVVGCQAINEFSLNWIMVILSLNCYLSKYFLIFSCSKFTEGNFNCNMILLIIYQLLRMTFFIHLPQNLYFFLVGGPIAVLFSSTTPKTTFPLRFTDKKRKKRYIGGV